MTSTLLQPPQMFRASMGITPSQSPMPQPISTRGNVPAPTSTPPQPPSNVGLTLPQVIALVDKRLVTLETFMTETQQNMSTNLSLQNNTEPTMTTPSTVEMPSSDIVTEYNHRFELLAEEISNLKHIVLSLQSYTMEVNKMLVEERVRVFSDMATDTESNHLPPSLSSASLIIHHNEENDNNTEGTINLGKYDENGSLSQISSAIADNITIIQDESLVEQTI